MCTRTKEINHRYHKAKTPEAICSNRPSGVALYFSAFLAQSLSKKSCLSKSHIARTMTPSAIFFASLLRRFPIAITPLPRITALGSDNDRANFITYN